MRLVWLFYGLGIIAASLPGFLSPLWFLGFIPLSAGLIWAAYDLVEVPRAESSTTTQRRS
jgi:hypothetical protein